MNYLLLQTSLNNQVISSSLHNIQLHEILALSVTMTSHTDTNQSFDLVIRVMPYISNTTDTAVVNPLWVTNGSATGFSAESDPEATDFRSSMISSQPRLSMSRRRLAADSSPSMSAISQPALATAKPMHASTSALSLPLLRVCHVPNECAVIAN